MLVYVVLEAVYTMCSMLSNQEILHGRCFPAVAKVYSPLLVPPKNPEGSSLNRVGRGVVVATAAAVGLAASSAIAPST